MSCISTHAFRVLNILDLVQSFEYHVNYVNLEA